MRSASASTLIATLPRCSTSSTAGSTCAPSSSGSLVQLPGPRLAAFERFARLSFIADQDGRSFDIGRIDFSVPANSVEVWTFTNATNMAHPMHVHGVKMSMLTRAGVAPAAYEQGLRDTFIVEAMQTVRVAVQTAAVASPSPLMFHCHILEHEDTGMMGQFTTV
mmetsp:Transcript_39104/g.91663  ORF Transcript_39104/g.91663 Transcript_39104/m.91663 type:complete len:164 (+) Transcript_39104:1323-1814(+)